MAASLQDPARVAAHRWLDVEVDAYLRRVAGRETFLEREGGSQVVVKRTRATERAESWYEFLRGQSRRSPARREFENLEAMAAIGVNVPRAITFVEDLDRSASAVVMEWVDHDLTLRDSAQLGGAGAWLQDFTRLVASLHERGWYHRDLYLQHVLVRRSDRALVLIDVGRARHERAPRERWFVKDLAAILHSTPAVVSARLRLRFLARYCALRGIEGRKAKRRWARRVVSKARRMAEHVPLAERGA